MTKEMEKMAGKKTYKMDYEIALFGKLPHSLREEIRTIDGEKVSPTLLDPLSLVCIEISDNSGVTPFFIGHDKTVFDFIAIKAKERELSLNTLRDKLAEML